MTPELTALACAVLVQLATLVVYAVIGNAELGPRVTLSPRDGAVPPLSLQLGRIHRALTNGFEALAMFTPAVLVVTVAGQSSGITQTAAWLFVLARLLYVPAYAFGLVPWRSAVWSVGFLATLALLLAALI